MALFDNLFGTPPEYLSGLLGQDELSKLQSKANTTGLINTALAFIAQPRNLRARSVLPYLGRALMAGQQSGQGVYENALRGFETQQKIADLKRKQAQQEQLNTMLSGISDPNERLYAQLAPEQYVTGKLKPMTGQAKLLSKEEQTQLGLPDVGRYQQKADGTIELVSGTAPKSLEAPSSVQEYQFARTQGFRGSFEDWKKLNKQEGVTVNYGAPVAGVDAQGNPVFFQPAKGGGAPAIVPGVAPPPREEKAPTESQAKAAAFGSQMQSASQEFDQIQKEGFIPGSPVSQAQVELAETPLRALADPLAQRAQQSQAQWAEAYLRYKTGAAATENEVKRNIATFFPKIGETDPKVIEQKARMRKQAEQDVLKSAKQQQIMPKDEQMPKTTRRKFNPATGRIE